MECIRTIEGVKDQIRLWRSQGLTIGLVPTMGYLHPGHLSLVSRACSQVDKVVMSIFVNPTQFGPQEDFERYPRNEERDLHMAGQAGVDLVFLPPVGEMYLPGSSTVVEVEGMGKVLCGQARPGHFRGVTTVVSKLFNIIQPDTAYFGQKDAQQAIIIRKMVRDLNFPVKIEICPTVREEDGLAMSSRNSYLSPEERKAAVVLKKSLDRAVEVIDRGERRAEKVIGAMGQILAAEPLARVEYLAVVDAGILKEVERLEGEILLALAVYIGDTRLIDNVMLEV